MTLLLQQVLQWWVILFVIGFILAPLTTHIFSSFFDKGYAFSKIIGLIFLSYLIYLFGTLHVLPFSLPSLILLLLLMIAGSLLVARKTNFLQKIKDSWKIFLFEDILFFTALFFWSYIKCFQPDIHGLEKFMDYGFLNSLLRTTYFPARDMWMTPLSINYYYFGHLMTAVTTKLSFLPSTITFNLMLATLFAWTFSESFSIGANLLYIFSNHKITRKKIITIIAGGLLIALVLTMCGNLHTIYTLFLPYQNGNPLPPSQLVLSLQTFPNQYWYPNATRFIYNTIHEFPIYSFVVSDLHGHVLDIPSVLLMIAALFTVFTTNMKSAKQLIITGVSLGALASIMYMTNAWDGLIYAGVATILLVIKSCTTNPFSFSLKKVVSGLAALFSSFVIVSLPFSLFFKPFASEIGINCAPQFLLNIGSIGPIIFEQGYCQHSPLWQLAILYGFFFFWFISLVALFYKEKSNKDIRRVDLFVIGMGVLGFTLIIIPEFVYLKDIYTTYFRANTMFKLAYQAFILLSIMSGYTAYRIFTQIQSSNKNLLKGIFTSIYILIACLLFAFVTLYPYMAITSYFNNLTHFQGLNGITYLKGISNDDLTAVEWINKHIQGQPVMLEAQGDSYTDYERISSNTGLPTVFGWMVHEWLWRGTYAIVPPRIADVTSLYESKDISQTKNLIRKYNVVYVYIGDMERTKYPKIDEEKFGQLGEVIYSSGGVKIYKIHD